MLIHVSVSAWCYLLKKVCKLLCAKQQLSKSVGVGTVFGAPVHCDPGTFTSPKAEIFHVGAHSSAHDLHSGPRLLMPCLSPFWF